MTGEDKEHSRAFPSTTEPNTPQHKRYILKEENPQAISFAKSQALPKHTTKSKMGSLVSSPLKTIQNTENLQAPAPPKREEAQAPSPLQNPLAYPSPDSATSISASPSQSGELTDSSVTKDPAFMCPFTGYPEVIWLKGRHKKLIIKHYHILVKDDSTQFFVFSNKPEDLALEAMDDMPTMAILASKADKEKFLAGTLWDHMVDVCEIVVTKFGGADRVSDELLAFLEFVKESVGQQAGQM